MSESTIQLPSGIRGSRALGRDAVVGLVHIEKTVSLVAVGLDGKQRWSLPMPPKCELAEVPDWRSDHQSNELFWCHEPQAVIAFDASGKQRTRIELADFDCLELQADEEIGLMLATKNALYLSIKRGLTNPSLPARKRTVNTTVPVHDLSPRVVCLDSNGSLNWSTRLPISVLAYEGISYIGVDTNGEQRVMPPWYPTTWTTFGRDLLFGSGDRLMATFAEWNSGVGCRYVLDIETGELKWKSDPSAGGYSAPGKPGQFLIGNQGYGEFETILLSNDQVKTRWQTHGHNFALSDDRLFSIQMANVSSQPQRCVELLRDGGLDQISEVLGGYYTTPPQMLSDGKIYFWRADKLWQWNPDNGVEVLFQTEFGDGAFGTSMRFSGEKVGFHIKFRIGENVSDSLLIQETLV